MSPEQILSKVLRAFFISLLLATVGAYAGSYVPESLFIPLIILELLIIVFAIFARKRKSVGYGILYSFAFISGVTSFPVIAHYTSEAGGNVVISAFFATSIIFGALATYAWKSGRDFRPLFGFLFAALLALVLIAIIHLFVPFSSMALLAASVIGVIVFSGWVLYDISVIRHSNCTEEDVPMLALNLYLDFINLFYDLLRILGFVK